MKPVKNHEDKTAAQDFGEMMKKFGANLGEIFDDPKVREKAREFAESVIDAAAKVAQNKVKDEEVRAKFRDVGKVVESLGNSLDKNFSAEKES